MRNNPQSLAILFLGVCIVIGSWIISRAITSSSEKTFEMVMEQNEPEKVTNRYEFIDITQDYFIVFDKNTGDYWVSNNSTQWEKRKSVPIKSN
ncbi:hypothetical protein [Peribacillus alkalitolerans]|uniref:hypothetical protein n=1 Tax=Peribacillus alkalitolerans TaxID=1550385 RepID=UPI0013D43164|nr:hypothetical protein [Peribacillus alkalitolerans]